MGTQNVREAMQDELSKENVPEVATQIESAEVKTDGEPTTNENADEPSDSEPDESLFEDRAEYKKALKDWTKKQAEEELRSEHKRVTDGYYADLRKARAKTRDLNQKLQEIQQNNAPLQKPVKPDLNQYSDPEAYANDMVKYDRQERVLEARTTAETQERQQAESNEIEAVWAHNAKESGIEDLDKVIEHVQESNLLGPLSTKVREDLVLSAAGPHMLRFLALNPQFVEEIADSPNPRLEMKQLETMMINSIAKTKSVALAPKVLEQAKPIALAPKYTPPTALKTVTSQTNSGNKNLAGASSMEAFMQTRQSLKRR